MRIVALAIATPVVAYVLGPVLRRKEYLDWVAIGNVSDFRPGETTLVTYRNPFANPWDGETANIPAYVRCSEPGSYTVFAINCAHLGCPVRWFSESQLFMCPCHGGVYYADGSRASGPPERGLFTYEMKVEGGKLHDQRRPDAYSAEPGRHVSVPGASIEFARARHEDRVMSQLQRPWYKRAYDWLERRVQLEGPIKEAALHPVPKSTASWWYVFGSASLVSTDPADRHRHSAGAGLHALRRHTRGIPSKS